MRLIHLVDSNDSYYQIWNGEAWKAKPATEVFDDMMFETNESLRDAVDKGINSVMDVAESKCRRKILDAVMTGYGTWLDIEFSEVIPEGCSLYDRNRGVFYSGSMMTAAKIEDERNQILQRASTKY